MSLITYDETYDIKAKGGAEKLTILLFVPNL